MQRRDVLRGGTVVAVAGLAGCLGSLTGGGTAEFRPAAEALNRGVDAVNRAQQSRTQADDAYGAERFGEAGRLYATARDRYDAAAAEFDTARTQTSGRCVAVHDRSVKQYRRALALVEACDAWAAAATAHATGAPSEDVTRAEGRGQLWDDRAAAYDRPGKVDAQNVQC